MNIWLDDRRYPLPGFNFWAKTAAQAIEYVNQSIGGKFNIDIFSFDHDLGENSATGYDVLCYVEKLVNEGKLKPFSIWIHTANGGAKQKMHLAANAICNMWGVDVGTHVSMVDYENKIRYERDVNPDWYALWQREMGDQDYRSPDSERYKAGP